MMRAMHGLLCSCAALSFMQYAIKFKCRQETRPVLGWPYHWLLYLTPANGVAQEIVAEGGEGGALLVVLAVAVAAGGGFVEIGFVAHCLQFGRHLAGVAGVDAVVAPAS